jgi:hypothetical protein
MPKTTQDELLDRFLEAAGSEAPDAPTALRETEKMQASLAETVARASGESEDGTFTAAAPMANAITTYRDNLFGAEQTSSGGGGETAASVARTVLESGLGLVPLIGGLIGLFDGPSPQPEFEKYEMPPPIEFQADDSGGVLSGVNYDAMGMPRDTGAGAAPASTAAAPAQSAASLQDVSSQWFLDHSSDIAAAVRNAMLNLNSINDVVNEL